MSEDPKILVVDDSVIVLEHARMLLSVAGFEVLTCEQPLNALTIATDEKPDIILVDVDMPSVNGAELVAMLRRELGASGALIFYFSDCDEDQLKRLAQATAADGYVCKGWPADELISFLEDKAASRRPSS